MHVNNENTVLLVRMDPFENLPVNKVEAPLTANEGPDQLTLAAWW